MVLHEFFSKGNGSILSRLHAASLHGEKVLQIDGEFVIYGSTWNQKAFYIVTM